MKPGITRSSPPNEKLKLPLSDHRMPTKLTSVTTAFSRPMLSDTLYVVNRFRSSWMRWSGLSGDLPPPPKRASSIR